MVLLLETLTVSPPAIAGPASVKMQVLLAPAVRLVGLHANEANGTMPIDTVAVVDRPFKVAVTVITS